MDAHSMLAANRLLGNRADAAVLEIMLSGAKLKVLEDTWLSFAGAPLGDGLPSWRASRFAAGSVLRFPGVREGLFAYLGVPGGIASEHWFGSASADARNGLGLHLKKGTLLRSVKEAPPFADERIAGRQCLWVDRRVFGGELNLGLLKGPQFDVFTPKAQCALVTAKWMVSARSDRTGFRLEGPSLEVPASIASEPVLPGSFQVPGNGQPIVTMVDGPTVGGYAKLAVLPDSERDRLAQCAPGSQVSFRWLD
jgi:biotin-dependent carboxylase-like uncharacterized protein